MLEVVFVDFIILWVIVFVLVMGVFSFIFFFRWGGGVDKVRF